MAPPAEKHSFTHSARESMPRFVCKPKLTASVHQADDFFYWGALTSICIVWLTNTACVVVNIFYGMTVQCHEDVNAHVMAVTPKRCAFVAEALDLSDEKELQMIQDSFSTFLFLPFKDLLLYFINILFSLNTRCTLLCFPLVLHDSLETSVLTHISRDICESWRGSVEYVRSQIRKFMVSPFSNLHCIVGILVSVADLICWYSMVYQMFNLINFMKTNYFAFGFQINPTPNNQLICEYEIPTNENETTTCSLILHPVSSKLRYFSLTAVSTVFILVFCRFVLVVVMCIPVVRGITLSRRHVEIENFAYKVGSSTNFHEWIALSQLEGILQRESFHYVLCILSEFDETGVARKNENQEIRLY